MNKLPIAPTLPPRKAPPAPMIGFTVHVPLTTRDAIKEQAYRDRISVSKWVVAAINAKLGKTTEQ